MTADLTTNGVLPPQKEMKMTKTHRSILVVSPDRGIFDSISAALASHPEFMIETQASTLAQMNGSAVKIASKYDMVLFQTRSGDEDDLVAIRAWAAARQTAAVPAS